MDRKLFREDGVKRMLKLTEEIGWIKWKFKSGLVGEGNEKESELLKPRDEGGGGWLKERSEKRRREILERARERAKKSGEKGKSVNEKDKELRREVERIRNRRYMEGKAETEGKVLKSKMEKGERERSERELIERGVMRRKRRILGGRKVLGEMGNR